jgi:hypothetical protein
VCRSSSLFQVQVCSPTPGASNISEDTKLLIAFCLFVISVLVRPAFSCWFLGPGRRWPFSLSRTGGTAIRRFERAVEVSRAAALDKRRGRREEGGAGRACFSCVRKALSPVRKEHGLKKPAFDTYQIIIPRLDGF